MMAKMAKSWFSVQLGEVNVAPFWLAEPICVPRVKKKFGVRILRLTTTPRL